MWQQIFLGFVGICSGVIIAGGAVGLMIGLSIVPRYAGITHTADSLLLYLWNSWPVGSALYDGHGCQFL